MNYQSMNGNWAESMKLKIKQKIVTLTNHFRLECFFIESFIDIDWTFKVIHFHTYQCTIINIKTIAIL